MTRLCTWVSAKSLALPTTLLARLVLVFTFTIAVTVLFTEVRATFELFATGLATSRLREPAGYVLHDLISTKTLFFCQEGTLGTRFVISVTSMSSLWMTARLSPFTRG